MCPPVPREPTPEALLIEVAERHRGSDSTGVYLRKLARTASDMITGRPVRPWRLDRLRVFSEDLATSCLRAMPNSGGCF